MWHLKTHRISYVGWGLLPIYFVFRVFPCFAKLLHFCRLRFRCRIFASLLDWIPFFGICTIIEVYNNMEVSWNRGTPTSSNLIGCSIINHPAIGVPPFMETPIVYQWKKSMAIPHPKSGPPAFSAGQTGLPAATRQQRRSSTFPRRVIPCVYLANLDYEPVTSWDDPVFL